MANCPMCGEVWNESRCGECGWKEKSMDPKDEAILRAEIEAERDARGCINCGAVERGRFWTSDHRVGWFCASCWGLLADHFTQVK